MLRTAEWGNHGAEVARTAQHANAEKAGAEKTRS